MSERDDWHALSDFTPARIALGRTGNSLPTRRLLEFQLAHARARDAVFQPFRARDIARSLDGIPSLTIETKALDRLSYLTNPDLGRKLSDSAHAQLKCSRYDAALVIADGLSAVAAHAHAAALARLIFAALPHLAWAPAVIVSGGRVAIGDEIAHALGADMAVVMIGERPGLSAADSLGLYLTFAPRPGITKDAERNCISNIRPGGLALGDAAHRLAWLMAEARRLQLTGIALKEDAPDTAAYIPHEERE